MRPAARPPRLVSRPALGPWRCSWRTPSSATWCLPSGPPCRSWRRAPSGSSPSPACSWPAASSGSGPAPRGGTAPRCTWAPGSRRSSRSPRPRPRRSPTGTRPRTSWPSGCGSPPPRSARSPAPPSPSPPRCSATPLSGTSPPPAGGGCSLHPVPAPARRLHGYHLGSRRALLLGHLRPYGGGWRPAPCSPRPPRSCCLPLLACRLGRRLPAMLAGPGTAGLARRPSLHRRPAARSPCTSGPACRAPLPARRRNRRAYQRGLPAGRLAHLARRLIRRARRRGGRPVRRALRGGRLAASQLFIVLDLGFVVVFGIAAPVWGRVRGAGTPPPPRALVGPAA